MLFCSLLLLLAHLLSLFLLFLLLLFLLLFLLRFKADLSKYIGSLEREHSVIVIGCTKLESGQRGTQLGGDDKDLNACFDRKLFLPAPNYATRTILWNNFLKESLGKEPPTSIDVSSLAQITEGYTAGGIKACIQSTVTTRRMERVEKNPLTEAEFLRALSRQPRVYREKNTGTFLVGGSGGSGG